MNPKIKKTGFTMPEVLITIVIIVMIVSIVYSTYCATARGARYCRSRMELLCQAQNLWEDMTRQIRCVYPGPDRADQRLGETDQRDSQITRNTTIRGVTTQLAMVGCFEADRNRRNGNILSLVTTTAAESDKYGGAELFEVSYKHEPARNVVLCRQRPLRPGLSDRADTEDRWQKIAENVESIELAFFDGRCWRDEWREHDSLPQAVRITMTLEDTTSRPESFTTTVYLPCSRGPAKSKATTMTVSTAP